MTPADNVDFVTVVVAGVETKFAKLSPHDVFVGILGEERKARKQKLIENLKLMEVPPDQWLGELEKFDDIEPLFADFVKFTNSGRGRLKIVDYSHKKANPDANKLNLTQDEFNAAVVAVCTPLGLTFGGNEAPPAPEGEDSANPPRPPAYGR